MTQQGWERCTGTSREEIGELVMSSVQESHEQKGDRKKGLGKMTKRE
jgi:hypothetical protein